MIRRILQVWPHPGTINALAVRYTLSGVLQGVVLVMLLPLLRALLSQPIRVDEALWWLVAIAVVGTAHLASVWWGHAVGYPAANRIMRDLQHDLGDHLGRLPLGWHVNQTPGRIARVVAQNTPSAAGIVSHVWPERIAAIATPATVALGVLVVDWRIGLAFLAAVPAAVLVMRWSAPIIRDTQCRMDQASEEAAAHAIEFAQAQPVFRATGRAGAGFAPMERALDEQRQAFRHALARHTLPQYAYVGIVQVGFTLVVVTGAWLATRGALAVPETVAILVLASRFIEPLTAIASLSGAIQVADVALERVSTILTASPLPEPVTGRSPAGHDIVLDSVCFGYEQTRVIDDLSAVIPAGRLTAIVGPSGSGKTTILRLIARFWDADRGAIRIGGADIREIPTPELMRTLAIVFQDTYLFDGSIEDNLRIAAPGATTQRLHRAAAAARLDDIVERHPDGWKARTGEGGIALSGGERQRVAIARALLKDTPIVLLDEATAALDPQNEAAVSAGISALVAAGRTVVIVAHKITTIQHADQILFLDGGRLVEAGDHDTLLSADGRYADFWRERHTAAEWSIRR
ncbi:ABC transporter ATP-binding protein [Micromonospora craniellae]|uniref:ABC transporter ATP-binding protein n=1 Tax=Micromonospora craniellae TaxID=2294034 RepID=A0A372FXU2_9ACTN|nr:ABC transporter ATP-binding protein [Micromonospora craniellae]RFS45605.1 ABC transporter ATP-binding protein [Micromonospora craniellae]